MSTFESRVRPKSLLMCIFRVLFVVKVFCTLILFRKMKEKNSKNFLVASFFENHLISSSIMSGRGKGKSSKKAVSRSAKAGLQFPVGRIARYVLYVLDYSSSFFLRQIGLGCSSDIFKKMNPLLRCG